MIAQTAQWDEGAETCFVQSTPYAVAAAAMGARMGRAMIDSQQVQWLDRRGLRLVPRGPLDAQGLRQLARHWGATVAVPEVAVQGLGLVPLVTPQHVALWDIGPEPATLLKRMNGKWRNRLVTAKGVVAVRKGNAATLGALLVAEGVQRAKRGYRALPAAFTQALPWGAVRVWEWRPRGQIQAAMCFVRHGKAATYHLGWAADAARAQGVHGVMLWQAVLALRAEGVQMLDLGLVDHDAAPGLARFKLGTGAALHGLGPTVLVLPG
jgi:Acetyltransferase (GNAT) domain